MKAPAAALCSVLLALCFGATWAQAPDLAEDARTTLLPQIGTLELRILALPEHREPGLQGILLHTSPDLLIEPSARLKLGGDLWKNSLISTEAGLQIVELALAAGVFTDASKLYSERVTNSASPPPAFASPARGRLPTPTPADATIRFNFGTFDANWHASYEADLPFAGALGLLTDIGDALDPASRALVGELLATLREDAQQPVTYLGSFTTARSTGEHAYVDELRLWRRAGALHGVIMRQAGLIGDTPVQIERIRIGGIDIASGELLALGSTLGFDGRLIGDRIEGRTQDGTTLVLQRGSSLAFIPELTADTVNAIDEWLDALDALDASGRFIIDGKR